MAKPKYSGNLAKPITPGLVELAKHGSFEDWLKSDRPKRELLSRLSDLLLYYGIDSASQNCWLFLSLALAQEHVPGFSFALKKPRGKGRPPKPETNRPAPSNKRGRPRKNTDENLLELLRIVEGKKAQLENKTGQPVTYKRTLEYLIKAYAKSHSVNETQAVKDMLPTYQQRISKARKKISKIEKNN